MNQQVNLTEIPMSVCERNVHGDYSLNEQALELLYQYYAARFPCSFDFATNPRLFVFLKAYHDYHQGEDQANYEQAKHQVDSYAESGGQLPSFVSRQFDLLVAQGKISLLSFS